MVEVFCHRFADTVDGIPGGRAIKITTDDVRKFGRAVSFHRKEISIGAIRKLGADAGATIVEVEVEVGALGLAQVAEVVVVFEVVAKDVGGADGGTLCTGGEGGAAVLRSGRPRGERGATGGVEIGRATRAIAFDVTRNHATDAAAGVVGLGVAVGAIDGKTVASPGNDR